MAVNRLKTMATACSTSARPGWHGLLCSKPAPGPDRLAFGRGTKKLRYGTRGLTIVPKEVHP